MTTSTLGAVGTEAGYSAPALSGFSITPSDGTDLTFMVRGIYIGDVSGGATLRITCSQGNTVNFAGLSAGSILPIFASRVHSTGTTAASLVGLY